MSQAANGAFRRTALAAVLWSAHAAQAGALPMSPWGTAAASGQPALSVAGQCLELEEVRSPGGIRFDLTWSREASCPGNAAAAPTADATPQVAGAPGGAGSPSSAAHAAPLLPAVPHAPTPQTAEHGPDPALPASPPASPAPEPVPLTSGLEAPQPEVTFTLELPQGPPGPATGPAITVAEVTGIGPPPVPELQPPARGTIPEPSSLWLLALGLGAAWRSRRR
jgi:hypothetical protein